MNSPDWLMPLSALYRGATSLRNSMFDAQILKAQKLPIPVVSVGNITAGGTGKTPMVTHLARYLSEHHFSVGIVSRGYGRKQSSVVEVTGQNVRAFGDEPSLMKLALPETPVFVGASRFLAGEALLQKYSVQLILADDAFQHRHLKRDMNVVLIDATQALDQYKTLPSGRAREGLQGLSRATHLIFTKTNAPGAIEVEDLREFFKPFVSVSVLDSAVEAEYVVGDPLPLKEGSGRLLQKGASVVLVSGIGRPDVFEKQCVESLGIKVVGHRKFRDHFDYSAADLKGLGDTPVLTTAKDRVKLLNLEMDFSNWYHVPLDVNLKKGSERFYEELVRLCS